MKRLSLVLASAVLGGCAFAPERAIAPGMSGTEVSSRLGQPVAAGRLASGEAFRDYSRQSFGYTISRVTFGADGRVREVRNLLTEDNVRNLHAGMTPDEVAAVVGPSAPSARRAYAGGTKSRTYRYHDLAVAKRLNVIFDGNDRVLTSYTEWDPTVYSKGGGSKGGGK